MLLSTRCGSCRVLLQELTAAEADWPEYEFIPIVSGAEDEAAAMRQQSGYRGRMYQDRGETMEAVGVRVTPTVLVIDAEGIVTAQGVVNSREMMSSLLTGHIRVNHELINEALLKSHAWEGDSP